MKSLFKKSVNLKISLFFVLSFLVLGSCEKNTIDPFPVKEVLIDEFNCPSVAYTGVDTSIIGKWKLMQWDVSEPLTHELLYSQDYSCESIIYEFRTDKKIIIKGDHEEVKSGYIDYTREYGYMGSKTIRIINFEFLDIPDPMWRATFSNEGAEMRMTNFSGMGPTLRFIRIQ